MCRRVVFLGFVMALSVAAAGADDGAVAGTAYEAFPSSLGFYTNSTGGVGLSWQRWYGNFGLAVAAGGLYNEEGSSPTALSDYDMVLLDYNAQVRLSWMLFAEEFSPWLSNNLHAVAYLAHRGMTGLTVEPKPADFVYYEGFVDTYIRQPFKAYFMAGAGVAVEATVFGHFSQTLDFMYVATWPLSLAAAVGYSVRYRY